MTADPATGRIVVVGATGLTGRLSKGAGVLGPPVAFSPAALFDAVRAAGLRQVT